MVLLYYHLSTLITLGVEVFYFKSWGGFRREHQLCCWELLGVVSDCEELVGVCLHRRLFWKIKEFLPFFHQRNSNKEYYIVYKNSEGETKTYLIGDIDLYSSFSNKGEKRNNAGFKAYCFARDEVRSFRHDRIISLAKK